MIDSSVWVDHLRASDPRVEQMLNADLVLSHPMVTGELALGDLRPRAKLLASLRAIRQAIVADHEEVMALIEAEHLWAMGIGFVDAHLLASTKLTGSARLWTRDKRLDQVARRLGIAAAVTH